MTNKIVSVTPEKFDDTLQHVLKMFTSMDEGVMEVRSGQTDPSYGIFMPDGRKLVLTRSDQGANNGFRYTAKLVAFDNMTEVDIEGTFVETDMLIAFKQAVYELLREFK